MASENTTRNGEKPVQTNDAETNKQSTDTPTQHTTQQNNNFQQEGDTKEFVERRSNERNIIEIEEEKARRKAKNPHFDRGSDLFNEAVDRHDWDDDEIQMCEHYVFNDKEFNEHGNF